MPHAMEQISTYFVDLPAWAQSALGLAALALVSLFVNYVLKQLTGY